jgi:flagellar protein FliS
MFGSTQKGAAAYTNIGDATGVASASPHRLVVMLFEGAMLQVTIAIKNMKAGNVAQKGVAISRAIAFIDTGLRASLDTSVGGEIALNLDALYAYMSKQLLVANIKNQPEILEEIHRLLAELKGAWEAIGIESTQIRQMPPPPVATNDPLAPRQTRLVKA